MHISTQKKKNTSQTEASHLRQFYRTETNKKASFFNVINLCVCYLVSLLDIVHAIRLVVWLGVCRHIQWLVSDETKVNKLIKFSLDYPKCDNRMEIRETITHKRSDEFQTKAMETNKETSTNTRLRCDLLAQYSSNTLNDSHHFDGVLNVCFFLVCAKLKCTMVSSDAAFPQR